MTRRDRRCLEQKTQNPKRFLMTNNILCVLVSRKRYIIVHIPTTLKTPTYLHTHTEIYTHEDKIITKRESKRQRTAVVLGNRAFFASLLTNEHLCDSFTLETEQNNLPLTLQLDPLAWIL